MKPLTPIKSKQLGTGSEAVTHGFFTRQGGCSNGIYAGLNVGLGSNDDPQAVLENRARVATHLKVAEENLLTAYQVHSATVQVASGPWPNGERPQVDAMVTNQPGLAIGALSADCGPVLFCDAKAGVIGAAHAGWKGAVYGILENTVAAMEGLGARRADIVAVLGPTISADNYEVGPEFSSRLLGLDAGNQRYLSPSRTENHAMFDLPGYILDRLERAEVNCEWTGHCTYADEDAFFSYRRKTHRNEPDYGRQISAISLSN